MRFNLDDSKARAIADAAAELGVDPVDLGTLMAYETIGKFSGDVRGGKNNAHIGAIQFGAWEQKHYGVTQDQTFEEQVRGPVVQYLKDRGIEPGMGLLDLYSTVNAGRPGLYNLSDNNGKDTVRSHVERMQKSYGPRVQQAFDALSGPSLGQYALQNELTQSVENHLAGDPVDVPTTLQGFDMAQGLPDVIFDHVGSNGIATPTAKRDNPANVQYADGAVGPLSDRYMGAPIPRTVEQMLANTPIDPALRETQVASIDDDFVPHAGPYVPGATIAAEDIWTRPRQQTRTYAPGSTITPADAGFVELPKGPTTRPNNRPAAFDPGEAFFNSDRFAKNDPGVPEMDHGLPELPSVPDILTDDRFEHARPDSPGVDEAPSVPAISVPEFAPVGRGFAGSPELPSTVPGLSVPGIDAPTQVADLGADLPSVPGVSFGTNDTPISVPEYSPKVQDKIAAPEAGVLEVPGMTTKQKSAKDDRKAKKGSGVGAVVGGVAGALLGGGVPGAYAGAKLGHKYGNRISNLVPDIRGFGAGIGNLMPDGFVSAEGFAQTPAGRATAASRAAPQGGQHAAYWSAYDVAGGGADSKSMARAAANEQRERGTGWF